MSIKQEIETWVAALAAYDNNEFGNALKQFEQIADTSKILFNVGVINATLGEHGRAVEFYQRAVQLDRYFAVAYFQQGVSNFLMGDFEEALANFNDTLLYLRGNNKIDYEQLGLKFKLYSCEVLFNRGLCYIYLQQKDAGLQDLIYAAREKRVLDHDVIEEAIKEQAEGYTVFSIPVGVVYRPNEAKVKNLGARDYLGKARLVAQQDQQHFDPRRQAALAAVAIDDRPEEKLSYAALNLVRPDLRSRSRQQSEPPMHRNVFPPTPPPEPERPDSSQGFGRRKSNDSGTSTTSGLLQTRPAAKPLRLELGAAAFEQRGPSERSRPKRSESERPAMRREYSAGSTGSFDGRRLEDPLRSRTVPEARIQDALRSRTLPEVRIQEDPIAPNLQGMVQSERPVHQAPNQQGAVQPQRPFHQAPNPPGAFQPQRPFHQAPNPPGAVQPQRPVHQRSLSSAHPSRNPSVNAPLTISEEEEAEDGSDPSDEPLAFEIIPPKAHQRQRSRARRPAEIRKIRIKVHAEDMRYVMTTPTVRFDELSEQIKSKFGFKGGFKLKVKDEEGDLITLGDQDDLDMAMSICKSAAAKDNSDMGKMEMWIHEI